MTSRLVERFNFLKKSGFRIGAVVQSVFGPELIMDISLTADEVLLRECAWPGNPLYKGRRISYVQFIAEYKLSPPLVQALYAMPGKKHS